MKPRKANLFKGTLSSTGGIETGEECYGRDYIIRHKLEETWKMGPNQSCEKDRKTDTPKL